MRRLLLALLALAAAPSATAAPPALSVGASAVSGAAPLAVTFTAQGDPAGYSWDFGDGSGGEGATVAHTYSEPGVYRVTLTATSPTGETAVQELVIAAFRLSLSVAHSGRYDEPLRFRGRLVPGLGAAPVTILCDGKPVARARLRRNGSFRLTTRLRRPGSYTARVRDIVSAGRRVVVRPRLELKLAGSPTIGSPLRLVARLRPAAAGKLDVRIWRGGRRTHAALHGPSVRLGLRTRRATHYRIRVLALAATGYTSARGVLTAAVVEPRLGLGSRGPSVLALERRLRELRYALPRVDRTFALDTYEAVLAFQKVQGLQWTGRVDARVWRALARARTPRARYPGNHIEISKGRQFLLVVRDGRVAAVVHVSTGATGNTPIGRFNVYRKVAGWDWVLWYPMYFLRGFAIHGYPSVPAYPASHGCVRVPMWIARQLYASNPYGQTIHVYW
jgi:PKD domain/L,D-transpeptidase catalytic domain/Putative peptidoglycan binding domain